MPPIGNRGHREINKSFVTGTGYSTALATTSNSVRGEGAAPTIEHAARSIMFDDRDDKGEMGTDLFFA